MYYEGLLAKVRERRQSRAGRSSVSSRCGPADARPQAPASAAATVEHGIDLDDLALRSLAAREEYTKAFRNLTVEETKIIEVFRASGEIEKRREIVSDLLVYHSQSSRDGKAVATEYRDVRLVNGKAEDNRGERASSLAQRTPQPSRRLT